nr:PREDICTED: chaperone protein dnaJ 49-like [Musa acuminata subsp. malaccensis]
MGMEALGTGDRSRAFKLLSEACRLDPSLPLDDLLSATGGIESSRSYTEEQVAIVHQIREQRDYHEILGFEHDWGCSQSIPETVVEGKEAFKEVSMPFQCVSEAENRERYDLCGSEEPALGTASSRHGFDDDDDDDDFDADEMLRS